MQLSLVFINDVHGYLEEHPELFYEGAVEQVKTVGGYSRIATFIHSVRLHNPHTLVLDGGDTFHGTRPVVQSKGEILLPLLNRLGIAAMVAHWDFAYGPEQLVHLARGLNYPVLGINVYQSDGSLLLPPYLLKTIGEVRVGIIGICCNIIDKTMPAEFSKGIYVTSGAEELPRYIEEVRAQGAEVVLLLSHNGFPQDYELLSKTDGVDVCLSAHTHNRLYEPVRVNQALVIQCGCHGSFAGHLELESQGGTIQNYRYELVALDERVAKDPLMDEEIRRALLPFREEGQQVVGTTPVLLHRYNTLNASMDNLLLAAIAHAAECSLGFSNGWRYGAPIPKGPIHKEDLYQMVPMNPPVATVLLTGREIKEMLEENIERTFACRPLEQMGGYLKRCFGLTAYIKIENPKGCRIQELYIGEHPYQKDQAYRAAFVTRQGVPDAYGTERQVLPIRAVDALTRYLETGAWSAADAHRVTFISV